MGRMMQVISGIYKRRNLAVPKGSSTRPTTSQMRQAVFNICQNEIEGARFLDICAGSGSIGIEALSRGALSATFIEQDHHAIDAIRQNIKNLQLEAVTEIMGYDALLALKKLEKAKLSFDICYFDPPYEHTTLTEEVLKFLDQSTILAPKATLMVEERADITNVQLSNLTLKNHRRFGNSNLYIYEHI